jgi:putative ABC transport system substrate-binding protein
VNRRSQDRRFKFAFAACALLFAFSLPVHAQQPKKVPRIGYLAADPKGPTIESFRQELKELGYVEGHTIMIEWRFAGDKVERFPELAAELVRLKPDAIVAANAAAVGALKQATTTVPVIIASYGGDLVADGVVASFARPGGNITGVTPLDPELIGKQLELLKETLAKLSRLAILWRPNDSGSTLQWREAQGAAANFGIQIVSLEVTASGDFEKAIENATRGHVDALLLLRNPLFYVVGSRKSLGSIAEKNRLAAMYPSSEFVDDGGLMSYGSSGDAQYRRAAVFVDKILKGAKPAVLPIEAPKKFEFVINLKAAKQIGLTIPPTVLYKADRVIK